MNLRIKNTVLSSLFIPWGSECVRGGKKERNEKENKKPWNRPHYNPSSEEYQPKASFSRRPMSSSTLLQAVDNNHEFEVVVCLL